MMIVNPARFGASAPYTKWRIRALKTFQLFGVTEVQFRTSVGGSQAATGGTAISSSNFSGFAAANAFDGNNTSEWVSNNTDGVGAWIGYQWASDIDIVEVTLRNRSAGADAALEIAVEKFNSVTSTWVTAWCDVFGVPQAGGTTFTSPKVTSKSIWAVFVTASTVSNFCSFGEIEMRLTNGGADQCSGGRELASSYFTGSGGFPPAAAFNNNTGDGWASNFEGPGAYCAYEFTSDLTIAEFYIHPRNAGLQESGTALAFKKWNYATGVWDTVLTASSFGAWATSTPKTFH